MGRYLDMLKHFESDHSANAPGDTLEDRADKTDILPESASVSGMSDPFPGILSEISTPLSKNLPPAPPLEPGWLVTYRNQDGKLCGGSENKEDGTVQECRWEAGRWTV